MHMNEVVLYIQGKGGSAGESEFYMPLFPECEVIGLDYQTFTPWETGKEIREAVIKLKAKYDSIDLIANSIGAFFSMNAGIDAMICSAYFISPVVDMEQLILNMMSWANGRSVLGVPVLCPRASCLMDCSDQDPVWQPG